MKTDNLRISETALNALENSDVSLHESGPALNSARRKLNRVSSMSFQHDLRNPITVGQRLTMRRLKLGLTQEQAVSGVMFRPKSGKRGGRDCVLSRNAYCMYERDLVPMSLKMVEAIAEVFGVSQAWLAFGIGKPTPKKPKGSPKQLGKPAAKRKKDGDHTISTGLVS